MKALTVHKQLNHLLKTRAWNSVICKKQKKKKEDITESNKKCKSHS